jgi:putative endonuclease
MTPRPADAPAPDSPPALLPATSAPAGLSAPSAFPEPPQSHVDAGRNGEAAALTYLLRRGYALRDRNIRFGRGELDLVMDAPDGTLVFVEVKTSRQDRAGDPAGWVTPRKQLQIARVAQGYCLERGLLSDPCIRPMRFDVIAVDLTLPGERGVRHIPHAFIPDGAAYWRTWG